jgi:hypothetical protein
MNNNKRPLLAALVAALGILPILILILRGLYIYNVPPFFAALIVAGFTIGAARLWVKPYMRWWNKSMTDPVVELTADSARSMYCLKVMDKVEREANHRLTEIKRLIVSTAPTRQLLANVNLGKVETTDDTLAPEDEVGYTWAMGVAVLVVQRLEGLGFLVSPIRLWQDSDSDDRDHYLIADITWDPNAPPFDRKPAKVVNVDAY